MSNEDSGTSIAGNIVMLILLGVVGLVEAYHAGYPWFLGLAAGILVGIVAVVAVIPILGIFLFKFAMDWVFHWVGVPQLTGVKILGWINAILVQVMVLFLIVAMIRWSKW